MKWVAPLLFAHFMLCSSPIFLAFPETRYPMNVQPNRNPSLPWRLATASVCLHLLYAIVLQAYIVLASPLAERMREVYARPEMLAPAVAQVLAGAILAGLVTWCTTQRWLSRSGAGNVDRPGKMVGVLLAVSLVYCVLNSAAVALLQHGAFWLMNTYKEWLDENLGLYRTTTRVLLLGLPLKLAGILLEILGAWVAVRVAAWGVTAIGNANRAPYLPRHAAWIAGFTLLLWQAHVSLSLGAFLQMHTLSADLVQYAFGYWVLPTVVLAAVVLACRKAVPQDLGTAGIGRAVAHGTFAFWVAQVAGVGLGILAIYTMTWNQLARAAGSTSTTVFTLAVYLALLVLGCVVGARLFYRRRNADESPLLNAGKV